VSGEYAARRQECEEAEAILGPLRGAELAALTALPNPRIRARAEHVLTEILRVAEFARLLGQGGALQDLGTVMNESHRSLSQLFEVSLPRIDELQRAVTTIDGVYGARITGAGFGGCLVVLRDPQLRLSQSVEEITVSHGPVWDVAPVAGAGPVD
jgi:galactokinase